MPALHFIRRIWADLTVPGKTQLAVLDFLRTVAILLVVWGHFSEQGALAFPETPSWLLNSPIRRFGWTGVDLFFVLSGFLIGGQLWRELASTGTVQVPRFLLRRGLRIWPLYFLFVIVSPALTATWTYKWPDWFFLSNYFSGRVEGGWSLSAEEQFYIILPLAILLFRRTVSLRSWLVVLPIVLLAIQLSRAWTAGGLVELGHSRDEIKQILYWPLHLHSEGLIVGAGVALVATIWPELVYPTNPRLMLRTWAGAAGLCIAAIGLRQYDNVIFPFLSLGVIYGALMVTLLSDHVGVFRRLHLWPFFTISRLSFGMYLNHFAILRWVMPTVHSQIGGLLGKGSLGWLLALCSFSVLSLVTSAFFYALIERPFLLWRDAKMGSRIHAPIAPA